MPVWESVICMQNEEARSYMRANLQKESLKAHCLATAAIMKALAARMAQDAERWEQIGLLHDIDYERVEGDMQKHGEEGYRMLKAMGIDEDIAGAVRRHNDFLFGDSQARVDVALQAADNISGLIIAAAAVKGGRITEVTAKTVSKKFKEKAFAAGCRREKVIPITQFIDLQEFFALAVDALQEIRGDLGLA